LQLLPKKNLAFLSMQKRSHEVGGKIKRSDSFLAQPKFYTFLRVTLGEVYTGCYKNVRVKFEDVCHACYSSPRPCHFCYGRGQDIYISQSNPRSMMQTWKKCEHCKGTGLKPMEHSNCLICKGTRKIPTEAKIRVEIEPGMKNGQTIVKQLSNISTALTLKIKRHTLYKCVGNDLYILKRISLKQALTGAQFTIETLDGRTLEVQTPQSMVVKPEFSYRIDNEGMPIFRSQDRNKRGALYIKFAVDFPQQPSADEINSVHEVRESPSLLKSPWLFLVSLCCLSTI